MFNVDKRILYIIIAIFAVSTIVQYIQNPMELLALLLTLPGVIVAITFHEFAHAFVADKLGDDTPRRQGRLNLNPLSHIDPVGFFMLIFAHFGWGKPVEINPTNFNRKRSMSAQEAIVALAGPVNEFNNSNSINNNIICNKCICIYFCIYNSRNVNLFNITNGY